MEIDVVAEGNGPLVVLVHSSMAGARQWSRLTGELTGRFATRAVNLFGYGKTPAWSAARPPSLDDFAAAVVAATPKVGKVSLVGHSFGGAVAMQAARRLGDRVDRLVLIEPSLFYLLTLHGRTDAYAEIAGVSERMAHPDPAIAAEHFIDYWSGPGAWAATSEERKAVFTRGVSVVAHEWRAVLDGDTPRETWATALPHETLLLCSQAPRRPSREIIELLSAAQPDWRVARLADGSHMAPLTHPQLVNPVVREFLDQRADWLERSRAPSNRE
jgi:pimeloyl-ACP methyl ester carboxylesterase